MLYNWAFNSTFPLCFNTIIVNINDIKSSTTNVNIIEIDSAINQYVNRYYHNIKIKEGDDFNKIK